MRRDVPELATPTTEEGPTAPAGTDRVGPAARPRLGAWVVGLLVVATSLSVGLAISWWLVPPYLAVVAWLLLSPGYHGAAEVPAPASDVVVADDAPLPSTEVGESNPAGSGPRARRGRGRPRAKVLSAAVPAPTEVRWVQVAPGKFLRVEQVFASDQERGVEVTALPPGPVAEEFHDPGPPPEAHADPPGPPGQGDERGFDPPFRPDDDGDRGETETPALATTPGPSDHQDALLEDDDERGDEAALTKSVETDGRQTSDDPPEEGRSCISTGGPIAVAGIAPDAALTVPRRERLGPSIRPIHMTGTSGTLVLAQRISGVASGECRARLGRPFVSVPGRDPSRSRPGPTKGPCLGTLVRAPPRDLLVAAKSSLGRRPQGR